MEKISKSLKTTLITGLWEQNNEKGKYLIGRIGSNLYAVVIPYKKSKDNQPDYHLFFVNGSKEEVNSFAENKANFEEDIWK